MPDGSRPYFDAQAPDYDRRSSRGLWSMVRKLEMAAVLEAAGPVFGRDVLELGCGSGFYASRLQALGADVLGVDASSTMVRQLEAKGLRGRHSDVLALSLNRVFPLVLAAGLLEFVEDEERFFRVARDHCEPGGALVILVPRAGASGLFYRAWHRLHGVTVRVRSPLDFVRAGKAAGWEPELRRKAGPIATVIRFRATAMP